MSYRLSVLAILFIFQVCVFAQQNKEQTGQKNEQRSFNGTPGSKPLKSSDITECPVHVPVNAQGYELYTPTYVPTAKANLLRSTQTMKFESIQLDDIKLNIPAFKQFKNNKTDFTEDGEKQFKELLERIKAFMSTDNKGKTFDVKVTGSASQIPTSFDPTKPNNNLRPDGSSIPGKTSIENNRLLAKARADELAKKIKHHFPIINVITPKLEEIKLGETAWSKEVQRALIDANKKKDKLAVDKVFEPFQKDQWVMISSGDKTSKIIQPEAVKMYMISTTPSLKTKMEGKEQKVNTIFIVSKSTYEKVGKNHLFTSVGERDRFLRKLGLKIFHYDKDSVSRFYLLSTGAEQNAFNTADYTQKINKLYDLGVSDIYDYKLISKHIKEEVERLYR